MVEEIGVSSARDMEHLKIYKAFGSYQGWYAISGHSDHHKWNVTEQLYRNYEDKIEGGYRFGNYPSFASVGRDSESLQR